MKNVSKFLFFVFVVVFGLTLALAVNAWTNPASNPGVGGGALYYSGGNVGIGTTGPLSKLSVGGAGDATYAIYGNGTNGVKGVGDYGVYGSGANRGVYGSGAYGVQGDGTSYGGYFSSPSGYALVTGTGNVGIGTPTPGYKLTVFGPTNDWGLNVNYINAGAQYGVLSYGTVYSGYFAGGGQLWTAGYLNAVGGVYDNGSRVYSANNPPPSSRYAFMTLRDCENLGQPTCPGGWSVYTTYTAGSCNEYGPAYNTVCYQSF